MFPAPELGSHDGVFQSPPGTVLRLGSEGKDLVDPIASKDKTGDQHSRRTEVRGQQDDPLPRGKRLIQMASAFDGGYQTLDERFIQAVVEETVDDMLITGYQVTPHQALDRHVGQLMLEDGFEALTDLAI
jgi:hypothetical protein